MSQFSVKGSFDGADLVKGFNDVKKEIKGLETVGEDAKKSLDQMLQQKNSTSNYRRQLMQLTQQLTDLTVNYRSLSDEEKQSEFGVALAKRIDELTAKASMFKDAMLDVQQSISESASDTANWDAFQQLVDVSTSALQSFTGVAGLSEESVEGLTRTIAAMQTIGAASNTVIKIGNALQKQSALMLGVRRTQELAAAAAIKLKTAAEVKGKAATVAATVAQKALNAVAKANPYVLLASAVITAGAALIAFSKKSNEAKEAELNHKEALEKAAEAAQNWRDKVSKAIEEPLSKYKLLAAEYKALKNTHEKTKWISDNKDAFEELGLSIDSLKSAEDAFVNNTGNVVQALIKRATAAAKQQQLTELATKYMDAKLRGEQEYVSKQKNAGDEVRSSSHSTISGDEYVDRTGKWVYTEQGAQKANAAIKKAAMTEANYLMEQMDKLAAEIAADMPKTTLKKPTTTTTTSASNTTVTEDIYGKDSLRAAQIEVQKLQDKLNRMDTTSPEFAPTKQALFEAEKKVKDIQDLMKQPSIAKTLVEQYDDAVKKINGIVKEYNIGIIDEETAKKQIEAINAELQKLGIKPIEIKVKNGKWDGVFDIDIDTKNLIEQYDDAVKKINDIVKSYNIGIIDEEKAKTQIEAINTELKKLGLKPIEIKLKGKWDDVFDIDIDTKHLVDQYDDAVKKVNDIVKGYNIGIIDEEKAKTQIETINNELKKLGLKPIDIKLNAKSKWDGAFEKDNDTKTAVDSVAQAYSLKLIDKDYAQEAIDAINVERINANLPPIHLNLDIEGVKQGIDKAMQMFDTFGSLGNVVSSINSVYESFNNLSTAMDDAENSWERFMVGFDAGMKIMNVFTTILETINTLMTTFQTIQELVTAAKLKDAAATSVQTAADTEGAGATMTKAGANMAETATAAGKAVSWIPVVGPVLAVAAIGTIMGILLSVISKSKFANGGIVQGASKIGDFNLVRVNGGELILNQRQQKNLFDMIDKNRVNNVNNTTGNVVFTIQGDKLVGVIDNYNKKRSRM